MNTTKISYDICPKPWRYHSESELKGLPTWGWTNLYSGGGYVAELGYYRSKAREVVHELANLKWLDEYTRAVFTEFTVYNAQSNYFSVMTLLTEFPPTGGTLVYSKTDTIRIYRYVGAYSDIILASELLVILVIFYFFYQITKKLYRQKTEYFKGFWNWVSLLQVSFAFISTGLYFIRSQNISSIMRELESNPFVFVNFQYTVFYGQVDTLMISLVVFLTTLKLIHLLKYNYHVKLLSKLFENITKLISLFMVEFSIYFIAFTQFAYIVFGAKIYDFRSLVTAMEGVLGGLLGVSYYFDLKAIEPILGPMFYLLFSFMMVFFLMNIFVAIMCSAFEDADDCKKRGETDPEIVEFFMRRFKTILGMKMQEHRIPVIIETDNENNKLDLLRKKISSRNIKKKIKEMLSSLDRMLDEEAQTLDALEKVEQHWFERSISDILMIDSSTC